MRRAVLPLLAAAVLASGCRGMTKAQPPIHLVQNMDQQARLDPDEATTLFPDGRASRLPVPGTVAQGTLREDAHLHEGKVGGAFAGALPASLPATPAFLARGRERYGIYCAPCHDAAGTGLGLVGERSGWKAPTLHADYIKAMPLGQLYDVVTRGVRTMPAYAPQVPTADRWAIAAYVRTLQVSQALPLERVPDDVRAAQGWPAPAAPGAQP
jgi:mono/diheme cytochrome c family protein